MKDFFYFVLIAAGLAVAWLAFPVAKERYFKNEDVTQIENTNRPQTADNIESNEQTNENPDSEDNPQSNVEEEDDKPVAEEEAYIDISTNDCENRCSAYQNDADGYKYCKQVCGLDKTIATPQDGCQSLEGLDIDYCYKDLAISKKDFKLCEKIQDKAIKTNCKNRITEDLFDN